MEAGRLPCGRGQGRCGALRRQGKAGTAGWPEARRRSTSPPGLWGRAPLWSVSAVPPAICRSSTCPISAPAPSAALPLPGRARSLARSWASCRASGRRGSRGRGRERGRQRVRVERREGSVQCCGGTVEWCSRLTFMCDSY